MSDPADATSSPDDPVCVACGCPRSAHVADHSRSFVAFPCSKRECSWDCDDFEAVEQSA